MSQVKGEEEKGSHSKYKRGWWVGYRSRFSRWTSFGRVG